MAEVAKQRCRWCNNLAEPDVLGQFQGNCSDAHLQMQQKAFGRQQRRRSSHRDGHKAAQQAHQQEQAKIRHDDTAQSIYGKKGQFKRDPQDKAPYCVVGNFSENGQQYTESFRPRFERARLLLQELLIEIYLEDLKKKLDDGSS